LAASRTWQPHNSTLGHRHAPLHLPSGIWQTLLLDRGPTPLHALRIAWVREFATVLVTVSEED
jgi:hypothetical protein